MKLCLIAAAFLPFIPVQVSADAAGDFESALRRALNSGAEWKMSKTFADSPLVVKSSGTVSCVKAEGIVWKTDMPASLEISMDRSGMTLRKMDGSRTSLEMPNYQSIRKAIDRFAEGEAASLDELFKAEISAKDGRWTANLTPKRRDMRMILKSASVSGRKTIETVKFDYASGECAVFEFVEKPRVDGKSRSAGE